MASSPQFARSRRASLLGMMVAAALGSTTPAAAANPTRAAQGKSLATHTAPARTKLRAAPASTAVARRHYQTGERLFRSGRYLEAAREYERGYAVSRLPGFLVNAANCYVRLGRHETARARYRQFLAAAPDSPRKREVERALASLPQRRPPHANPRSPAARPKPPVRTAASKPRPVGKATAELEELIDEEHVGPDPDPPAAGPPEHAASTPEANAPTVSRTDTKLDLLGPPLPEARARRLARVELVPSGRTMHDRSLSRAAPSTTPEGELLQAPPPETPPHGFTRTPWFWSVVGGLVGAAVAGTVVVLAGKGGERREPTRGTLGTLSR